MGLLERSSSKHLRTRGQTWRLRQRQGSYSVSGSCHSCLDLGIACFAQKQWSLLHWAAANGHADLARKIMAYPGVDVDMVYSEVRIKLEPANILFLHVCSLQDGTRPLHWAAFRGSVGVAKLLLENRRVDINAHDLKRGLTPLHWTALPDLAGIANKAGKAHVASMLLADLRIDASRRDKVWPGLHHCIADIAVPVSRHPSTVWKHRPDCRDSCQEPRCSCRARRKRPCLGS